MQSFKNIERYIEMKENQPKEKPRSRRVSNPEEDEFLSSLKNMVSAAKISEEETKNNEEEEDPF